MESVSKSKFSVWSECCERHAADTVYCYFSSDKKDYIYFWFRNLFLFSFSLSLISFLPLDVDLLFFNLMGYVALCILFYCSISEPYPFL